MFADRENELNTIKDRLHTNKFELIILYGRRRIGKTRLILESVKNVEHVYFFATESMNLKHFKNTASKLNPKIAYAEETWEAMLNFLEDRIIIIDEFPNLIKENPSILSELQKIIDTKLKNTKTKLILLGSSISMMGDRLLSYHSPLYGRKTSSFKLKPLKFKHLKDFFSSTSWHELCETFGFTDGIPFYIEQLKQPFWSWLENELILPDTFIKYEIDFLMRYEFDEVGTYKQILEAIANGKHTPAKIRDFMGVRHSDITPYLRNLMEVEFIEREVPITEGERSRFGRYFLKDNLLKFWFRFIYPNLSAIEEGIFSINQIKREYNTYLGYIFEKVAKEFVLEINNLDLLPFKLERLGRWWRKNEEIDLVGFSGDPTKSGNAQALFFEVKWSALKHTEIAKIIKDLRRKAELMDLEGYEKKYYGVIAKKVNKGTNSKYDLVFDLDDFDEILY